MNIAATDRSRPPLDVLVLLGCFGRGIEATGPNQSMLGMANALDGEVRFRIVAEAVPGDEIGAWQTVKGLPQLPLGPGVAGIAALRRVLRFTPHDLLISNGFFDRRMTLPMLVMRRLGLVPRKPTLVAPRGEFSPGAFALGKAKKEAYVRFVQHAGLLRGVTLQATGAQEAEHIAAILGPDQPVVITPNLRRIEPLPPVPFIPAAKLRIVFASRIDRKKNLHVALEQAARADLPVRFDIFGPVSDAGYWDEVQATMAALPDRVEAHYCGVLSQADLAPTLARYDLMMLPTLGENFGHSIADALLAGVPVVLSDQTPWRDLEQAGVGWDRPLTPASGFADALRSYASLSDTDKLAMRRRARAFAEAALGSDEETQAVRAALWQVAG